MAAHSTMAGSNLHENKGVASASNDFVATATSGATVWKKITSANIDATSVFNVNKFKMTVTLPDISTASSVYVVVPVAATCTKVWSVLGGAIATADATITCRNHAGTSMGTLTVAFSGSAAKDVDSLTPGSNNTFTAGQVMTIETNGNPDNTIPLYFTLEFTQTA